jgi:hypothetical protein
MRALPHGLLALLLAATAIGGCTGDGGGDADGTDVVDDEDFEDLGLHADDSTGILRGVVIDEAIRPIEGALVTVLIPQKANQTQTTKGDGLFGFDKLEPGDFFLQVSAPGFVSVQASATVKAGVANPDPVKVQLLADPLSRPFVETFHLDAFVSCSVRGMFLAYPCGTGDEDVVNADHNMARRPDWIQSEMTWESTQAIGDELSLSIRCLSDSDPANLCPEGQRQVARSEGLSPQIAYINRTVIDQWKLGGPDGNPLSVWIYAFGRSDLDAWDEETIDGTAKPVTGKDCLEWQGGYPFPAGTCMRATGPGLIINQKVDVFTNAFYGFVADPDWLFIEDGPHPVPA